MNKIIGRKQEIKELERLYQSPKAECVVITGRRRIGKTYLVREVFKDRLTFYHTGLSPYDEEGQEQIGLKEQLLQFFYSLKRFGYKGRKCPTSWLEAFFMLTQLLEKLDKGERQVVFIDELPWMDTRNSHFLQAFEGFVNGWALGRSNMMLILCGSATSWVEENFIQNKKGLYNRQTDIIRLSPFTLKECEAYYEYLGVGLSRFDIVEGYMAFGGVPYYMGFVSPEKSMAQNIDNMFFSADAKLKGEFDRLLGSLFRNPDKYLKIIRLLGTRHSGYTRDDIIEKTGIPSGRELTQVLSSLEASCFIKRYQPFGQGKSECRYMLIDNYILFHLSFFECQHITDTAFWQHSVNAPAINSWRGLAFEEVCFSHSQQIKNALGVGNVVSTESAWRVQGTDEKDGGQMDLIISRNDNVVNLCEMKYLSRMFAVDKECDLKLRKRIGLVQEHLNKKQRVNMTLVTTFGLEFNKYSNVIQNVVTIDDIFDN